MSRDMASSRQPDIDNSNFAMANEKLVTHDDEIMSGVSALKGERSRQPVEVTDDESEGEYEDAKPKSLPKKEEESPSRGGNRERTLSDFSNQSEGHQIMVDQVKKLTARLTEMYEVCNRQDDAIRRLLEAYPAIDEKYSTLAARMSILENNYKTDMDAMTKDFKQRITDSVQIHKETPELVERLLTSVTSVTNLLPEELKAEVKEVKLTPKDTNLLTNIRQQTTGPAMKRLPKHMR